MNATKPGDPRQWREAERWLARAHEDVRAAEALIGLIPASVGTAAFHCQQAVEKMAKALLVVARVRPPRLHDIQVLSRRIEPHFPEIARAFGSLGALTPWYAAARYPDTGFDIGPSVDDVRETLVRVRTLRNMIDNLKGMAPSI